MISAGDSVIKISISATKEINITGKGKQLHPLEVCKVLTVVMGQLLGGETIPEESEIIDPKNTVIKIQ